MYCFMDFTPPHKLRRPFFIGLYWSINRSEGYLLAKQRSNAVLLLEADQNRQRHKAEFQEFAVRYAYRL